MPCLPAPALARTLSAALLGPALLGLLLLVAGCDAVAPTTRQVAVLDGAIHVRAPQFYCVDTQSARGGGDTAVVLIGRCTEGGQVAAALVTVTVGRAASAGVMLAGAEALRGFMASPAGRRVLARRRGHRGAACDHFGAGGGRRAAQPRSRAQAGRSDGRGPAGRQ